MPLKGNALFQACGIVYASVKLVESPPHKLLSQNAMDSNPWMLHHRNGIRPGDVLKDGITGVDNKRLTGYILPGGPDPDLLLSQSFGP